MNCRRLESLAADFAAGKISPDLVAPIERHCDGCPSCARLLRSEMQMRQAWSDRTTEESRAADLWPRIASRLEPRRRRILPAPRLVWSGVAAALAVVGMMSLRLAPAPSAHPVTVPVQTVNTASAGHENHVASTETAASWPAMDDGSAPNAVVDDPAGRSMEEIWIHINSANN